MAKITRTGLLLVLAVVAAAQGGCDGSCKYQENTEASEMDLWLMQNISDMAVENAIIRQHVLYAYHYEADSAKLNDLGRRDLGVLITHYKENGGQLSIRRGEESDALYRQRVQTVTAAIKDAGVDPDCVRFTDGMPGGDGMSGDRVVRILLATPGETVGVEERSVYVEKGGYGSDNGYSGANK